MAARFWWKEQIRSKEAPRVAGCWHTGRIVSLSGGILGRPYTQYTVEAPTDPARVWALWANPKSWPSFYPGLGSVDVTGDFKVGASLTLRPAQPGPSQRYELQALTPGVSFLLLQRLPFATAKIHHQIEACDLGCRIQLRIEVEGPLAWLHQLSWGREWKAAMPLLLRALAKAAQKD